MSLNTKRNMTLIKAALQVFAHGNFDEEKVLTTRYLNKHFIEPCTELFDIEMLPKTERDVRHQEWLEKHKKVLEEVVEEQPVEEVVKESVEETNEEPVVKKDSEDTTTETVEETVEEEEESSSEEEPESSSEEESSSQEEKKRQYTRLEMMGMTKKSIADLYSFYGFKVPHGMRKVDLINDFLHKYTRMEDACDEDLKMGHFEEEYKLFKSLNLGEKLKFLKDKGFMARKRTGKGVTEAMMNYFTSKYKHLKLEVCHF